MTHIPCQVTADLSRYERQMSREQAYDDRVDQVYKAHYDSLQEEMWLRVTHESVEIHTDAGLADEFDIDDFPALKLWFTSKCAALANKATDKQIESEHYNGDQ